MEKDKPTPYPPEPVKLGKLWPVKGGRRTRRNNTNYNFSKGAPSNSLSNVFPFARPRQVTIGPMELPTTGNRNWQTENTEARRRAQRTVKRTVARPRLNEEESALMAAALSTHPPPKAIRKISQTVGRSDPAKAAKIMDRIRYNF